MCPLCFLEQTSGENLKNYGMFNPHDFLTGREAFVDLDTR